MRRAWLPRPDRSVSIVCSLIEHGGSPAEHLGIERVQVATHGGGGIRMAQDLLDVEPVEMMRPVSSDRAVEQPGRGPAQTVGCDVAEPGRRRPTADDLLHRHHLSDTSVGDQPAATRPGLPAADDRLIGAERAAEQLLPRGGQRVEGGHERRSRDDSTGPTLLSDPRDGRLGVTQADVTHAEVDHVRSAHPGQAQADDRLVPQPEIGPVPAGADQRHKGVLPAQPPRRA